MRLVRLVRAVLTLAAIAAEAPPLLLGAGCTHRTSIELRDAPLTTAQDVLLSTRQNQPVEGAFAGADAEGLPLTYHVSSPPQHGTVRVTADRFTYTPDALAYGADSFGYVAVAGDEIRRSAAASVRLSIEPVERGTSSFGESYESGGYQLSGWRNVHSTYGVGFTARFSTTSTFGNRYARHLEVQGDSADGLAANMPPALYVPMYGGVPAIDGSKADAGQLPWIAELIHISECIADVTMTLQFTPAYAPGAAAALLINYRVTEDTEGMRLTGYQLVWNGGGAWLAVSRFISAGEHAFDYVDRWPGLLEHAEPNPVEYGPYKGWDHVSYWKASPSTWPAGGQMGYAESSDKVFLVAVRYVYEPAAGAVTLAWEARDSSGADLSPGVWDMVRVFEGADALAPGGDFGFWTANYRRYTDPSHGVHGGVYVDEIKIECRN